MSPRIKEKTVKNSVARCLYILHLITLAAPAEDVTGLVNGGLHLPCSYTVSDNTYVMCWGRGQCSIFGCNEEIIKTDGTRVTWRKSVRYQLRGSIQRGGVSLTITGLTKEDEGTYCCRVKVDGWFNDQKKDFKVKIENAKHSASTDTHPMITMQTMYDTHNDFYTPVNPTPWNPSFGTQETLTSEQPTTPYVIAAVCGALLLVLIGVTVYISKYRRGEKKTESARSVVNVEALARSGTEATENIYTE